MHAMAPMVDDRPAVDPTDILITEESGTQHRLTHIDGMTLEQYFDVAGIATPPETRTAVAGGKRLRGTEILDPGTSVSVAQMVRNG